MLIKYILCRYGGKDNKEYCDSQFHLQVKNVNHIIIILNTKIPSG